MNLDEFTFLANTFKFAVPITAVLNTVKGKLAPPRDTFVGIQY